MAQLPPGYPRFAHPPPRFSFRPPPRPPPPPSSYKALSVDSSRGRGEVTGLVFFCVFFFLVITSMICTICCLCWGQRNRSRARWAAPASARAAAAAAGPETPSESSRRARAAAAAAAAPETPSEVSSSVRVDEQPLHRACAASPTAGIPMFTYSQSVKHNVTGPEEEAATCSVCLSALQLGDTVRLLPVCLHLYHAECIDPWLDAHSTCPICRSDTDPTIGVGRVPPV